MSTGGKAIDRIRCRRHRPLRHQQEMIFNRRPRNGDLLEDRTRVAARWPIAESESLWPPGGAGDWRVYFATKRMGERDGDRQSRDGSYPKRKERQEQGREVWSVQAVGHSNLRSALRERRIG
ncbi:hypothetical protein HPP92_012761 [Vanilla planifolia]|uniref:Uncharacterized protein n=1 Tax=Vanilla planifolia TaxID=51239 RepID=A0A835QPH6_VANPL|nr:hypothetical protein HPP92_013170 [Vanilla planifolia]KAG0478042.1 hypothetical protein HPP92_012761 [Vanilla planifolia]